MIFGVDVVEGELIVLSLSSLVSIT
jgi:hypothetical protein